MTTTKEERLSVANTIINQMGGANRLGAMIGANGFMANDDECGGLVFSFKSCRKANKCRVTLLDNDTYRFELLKFNRRTYDWPVVYELDNVYWDMLKSVFEKETGLYLSL